MKLYKFLFLLFFGLTTTFANIKLDIHSEIALKNEPFVFSLEAYGNNIEFPDISQINGNITQEISNSISTNIVNGELTKKIKKTYTFIPTIDFIFPSLEVLIDGKSYFTKEQKILLQNVSKTKSDKFDLSISSNSNEFYVGENFILTMTFKYKKTSQIENLSLEKPNFENFWYKQIDQVKNFEDGDYIITEIKFLMFALKDGSLSINPLKINAQVFDNNSYSIFSSTKNEKIYSNELNFNIKKLPENIKLIGDFDIESSIDKNEVKRNEAVSYRLKISGKGNIDDVSDFKLYINDATIYENKPIIKSQITNGSYEGTYEKVFSIISNNSFLIPSITLEYFDKNLNKLISKQSKSFEIKVLDEELKKEVILEKAQEQIINEENKNKRIKIVEKSSFLDKIIYFSLGIITSLLIISLYFYVITSRRKKEENNKPLLSKVRDAKSKIHLIKVLAKYLKIDSKLDKLIFELEKTEDIKSLKKEIIKVLKELKL